MIQDVMIQDQENNNAAILLVHKTNMCKHKVEDFDRAYSVTNMHHVSRSHADEEGKCNELRKLLTKNASLIHGQREA